MSERDAGFYDELASTALTSGAPILDVVSALLESDQDSGIRVVELGAHIATLVARSGKVIRIFRAPGDAASLSDLVEQIAAHNPRAGTEIIIVGGGPSETGAIKTAVPKLLMHPFLAFHRTSSGDVHGFPSGKGEKSPHYQALKKVRTLSEEQRREVLAVIQGHARSLQDEQKERARFFRGMNIRVPIATYGILGLIAVMFLLQNAWAPRGGNAFEERFFPLAMGALFPPLVHDGQWYRLISAGFLHGGLMHVGMNGFVLYLLGGQMERVLGSSRFILLYTFALVMGSLASLQFLGNGMSVGASGAVWGLLGAQVALAYGRPPVLPKSVQESIKPLARQNVLLNVGISFLPGIDAAAHFGGGLAGAVLLASGLLYRKSERPSESGGPPSHRPIRGVPPWLPVAAILCVVLLLWGVASALLEGQPWDTESQVRALLQRVN